MKEIMLSEEEIQAICKRVGEELNEELQNEEKIPILVGVLKGALNFMLEVMKYIKVPVYTDYIHISSYKGTIRDNAVRLLSDISYDCTDRTVVIIEDIVDTGHSMNFLIEHIKRHQAKKVLVCTMIDKVAAREIPVPIDFRGFTLNRDKFLIGFGLDYRQLERNLPYIYEADEEDVQRLEQEIETRGDTFII